MKTLLLTISIIVLLVGSEGFAISVIITWRKLDKQKLLVYRESMVRTCIKVLLVMSQLMFLIGCCTILFSETPTSALMVPVVIILAVLFPLIIIGNYKKSKE